MAIQFDTGAFEALHGKKPRGTGLWKMVLKVEDQIVHTINRDGPYPQARDYAFGVAKDLHRRDVETEVRPHG